MFMNKKKWWFVGILFTVVLVDVMSDPQSEESMLSLRINNNTKKEIYIVGFPSDNFFLEYDGGSYQLYYKCPSKDAKYSKFPFSVFAKIFYKKRYCKLNVLFWHNVGFEHTPYISLNYQDSFLDNIRFNATEDKEEFDLDSDLAKMSSKEIFDLFFEDIEVYDEYGKIIFRKKIEMKILSLVKIGIG